MDRRKHKKYVYGKIEIVKKLKEHENKEMTLKQKNRVKNYTYIRKS